MSNHRRISAALAILIVVALFAMPASAEVTVERSDQGAIVKIDGELFTEYVTDMGPKPILWPIIGPTGKPITRAYPMAEGPNEREDHPHHRSLWFTHDEVNGVNFWHENDNHGYIKHREFAKLRSGDKAVIVAVNDWLAPDGKKVLEDQRILTFGTLGENRYIDFDITLKATEGPVHIGDTKEGTMGIRVAGTMKVDAGLGGEIVNSHGQKDKEAWGKQAPWVDYHGPVDGKTVGVTIMNHPTSFRFPTYWHVRTYGLFTANPFGLSAFTKGKQNGKYTIPARESITLRYRFYFHKGDEVEGQVCKQFEAYAK